MSVARWHYRDGGLLWLFVPAYLAHIAEEWFGGFPAWFELVGGRPLPVTAFVLVNSIALVFMAGGLYVAIRDERYGWIAVTVATVLLVNAVVHAASAVLTGSYSPGLISAVVLYIPIGGLAMMRAVDHAPRAHVTRGVLAGLLVHALVALVAVGAAQLVGG